MMRLSFQKLFFIIATVFAIFAILILAKTILIPLSIALLISFILLPLVKRFEKWRINKTLSVFLAIFSVVLLIAGIIFLFSTQIFSLSADLSEFKHKIVDAFADITLYINSHVPFIEDLEKDDLLNRIKTWLSDSTGVLVSKSISGTTSFFTGLVATFIFTFLFLIYRKGLTIAFASFAPKEHRERVVSMFKSIQQVGKKYLVGMFILVTLVGIINSIGLWIIGLDNPFFFGFLGAVFSILPYIGTIIGTIIPVVFALVSYDTIWIAVGIIILFWAVQLLTDNFLTPKIVGSSLDVNALASILSIIIGASVWGAAGMILFLPYTAMLKVVCEEFEELKPIALLIGTKNYTDEKGTQNTVIHRWANRVGEWFSKSYASLKKKMTKEKEGKNK